MYYRLFDMKITLLKTIILAVSVFGIATSPAATILFTNTLPTSDVIRSNTGAKTGDIQVRNYGSTPTSNNRWVGVGFSTISAISLDKVTFFIAPNGTPTATALGASMTISIVSLASLTASPSAPFTPLYSESATVPTTYNNESYITFDLASSYSLSANSYYGVLVSFNTNDTNRAMNFTQVSGTGGKSGIGDTFYTADQGATYTNNTAALNFVAQSVPEPSTTALLAIVGGAAIASIYRSRRRSAKA